jgi:hypothetical protein
LAKLGKNTKDIQNLKNVRNSPIESKLSKYKAPDEEFDIDNKSISINQNNNQPKNTS